MWRESEESIILCGERESENVFLDEINEYFFLKEI